MTIVLMYYKLNMYLLFNVKFVSETITVRQNVSVVYRFVSWKIAQCPNSKNLRARWRPLKRGERLSGDCRTMLEDTRSKVRMQTSTSLIALESLSGKKGGKRWTGGTRREWNRRNKKGRGGGEEKRGSRDGEKRGERGRDYRFRDKRAGSIKSSRDITGRGERTVLRNAGVITCRGTAEGGHHQTDTFATWL